MYENFHGASLPDFNDSPPFIQLAVPFASDVGISKCILFGSPGCSLLSPLEVLVPRLEIQDSMHPAGGAVFLVGPVSLLLCRLVHLVTCCPWAHVLTRSTAGPVEPTSLPGGPLSPPSLECGHGVSLCHHPRMPMGSSDWPPFNHLSPVVHPISTLRFFPPKSSSLLCLFSSLKSSVASQGPQILSPAFFNKYLNIFPSVASV